MVQPLLRMLQLQWRQSEQAWLNMRKGQGKKYEEGIPAVSRIVGSAAAGRRDGCAGGAGCCASELSEQ